MASPSVTGAARYASDEPVARPVFGFLVTSSIARGRIEKFDLGAAKSVERRRGDFHAREYRYGIQTAPGS